MHVELNGVLKFTVSKGFLQASCSIFDIALQVYDKYWWQHLRSEPNMSLCMLHAGITEYCISIFQDFLLVSRIYQTNADIEKVEDWDGEKHLACNIFR